jgi:hypothetical protein
MKINLEMDRARAKHLQVACFIMAAMGRGEFLPMFDLLRPGAAFSEKNRVVWDEQDWLKVEACLKAKLTSKKEDFKAPKECLVAGFFALYVEYYFQDHLLTPSKKVEIELEHDEACQFMRACEIMARIGMGQFKDLIELFNPKLNWDETSAIEMDLKGRLYPGMAKGAYYAMHNDKCPEECKVAWDAYQHIRREISWYGVGKDWRKDECSNGMRGVSFDEPFKTSKLKGDFKVARIK